MWSRAVPRRGANGAASSGACECVPARLPKVRRRRESRGFASSARSWFLIRWVGSRVCAGVVCARPQRPGNLGASAQEVGGWWTRLREEGRDRVEKARKVDVDSVPTSLRRSTNGPASWTTGTTPNIRGFRRRNWAGCQVGLLILLPLSTLHDHEQGRMDHAC